MRENVDLERSILLCLEENDEHNEGLPKHVFADFIKNSGFQELYVLKHCRLLEERGFINLSAQSADNNLFYNYRVGPMKAKGYDFIASTRDNEMWKKIKEKLINKGVDAGITIIADNLPSILKDVL